MTMTEKAIMLEEKRATEHAVYLNARDCIYYGYGKSYCNRCGLNDDDFNKVWNKAKNDMSKEF